MMLKVTFLAVLLLVLTIDDTLGGRRGGRRGRPRSGESGGRSSSDRSCEVIYNGEEIPASPCDDDEFCSDEGALTLTRGQDTVTFKFCNKSLDITPKLACRVENASGAVLHERPCLVHDCNSDPYTYNNTDNSGSKSSRERFPGELLTLFFCLRRPTEVDYSPLVYNRACRIRDNDGNVLRNGTCRPNRDDPNPTCPDDSPVTLTVQGVDLQLDFCRSDFNITDLFGRRRGDSSSSEEESEDSDSVSRRRGGNSSDDSSDEGNGRGRQRGGASSSSEDEADDSREESRGGGGRRRGGRGSRRRGGGRR